MNPLNEQEKEAVATLCLMAALADGSKSDEERAQIKDVARHMGGGDLTNGMHETQREQELAERRNHLDQLGHLTLGDEMKLIEHELDKLKEQMQALRLWPARGPEREIHAGHRLHSDAPALS